MYSIHFMFVKYKKQSIRDWDAVGLWCYITLLLRFTVNLVTLNAHTILKHVSFDNTKPNMWLHESPKPNYGWFPVHYLQCAVCQRSHVIQIILFSSWICCSIRALWWQLTAKCYHLNMWHMPPTLPSIQVWWSRNHQC